MRRTLLLTLTALLLVLVGCGGADGADADGPSTTASTGTSSTSASGASSTSTTAAAVVEGDLLEPGELPAPWVAATDAGVHTFAKLGPEGAPGYAVSCPPSLTAGAAGNTQCATYTDEGGPFASLTVTASDGRARTTLLCQSGGADSLDFTAFAALDATIAVSGLGATDADGRLVQANAYTTGTGTHWFAFRRPAGQDCPVLWDLGADDGTLAGAAALAAVILPLADGPTCVFVVTEGLRTRPAEAGTCAP